MNEPAESRHEQTWSLSYGYGQLDFMAHTHAWAAPKTWIQKATVGAFAWIGRLYLFGILGFLLYLLLSTPGPQGERHQPEFRSTVLVFLAGFVLVSVLIMTWDRFSGTPKAWYRAFRQLPQAGEKMSFTIGPAGFRAHNRLLESTTDWKAVGPVDEFRDGFLIQATGITHWIPKRLLDQNVSSADLADALRGRVADYRVHNRAALASPWTAKRPRADFHL